MISGREVGLRLGVSGRTILRWTATGLLPAYKVGGVYRCDELELDKWIAARRTSGPAETTAATPPEKNSYADLLGLHTRSKSRHRPQSQPEAQS